MNDERQSQQYEIDQLRKSLSILYAHSLKIQQQRDILERKRDRLVEACESGVAWIQGNYRAKERPKSLLKKLEDAIIDGRGRDRRHMTSDGLNDSPPSILTGWVKAPTAGRWRHSLFARVNELISRPNT